MRLLSWMVHRGPLVLAGVALPVLAAALVIAAPQRAQPPKGGRVVSGPPAAAHAGAAPATRSAAPTVDAPAASTAAGGEEPNAEATAGNDAVTGGRAPATPGDPAPLLCTPLRGRPAQQAQPPVVTLEGVIDQHGEQVGRRLSLRARRGTDVNISLPADSFAGQPQGDWLVYGAARGKGSEVRAIDLETGCDVRLARVDGVARSAVLAPDGGSLYVHQVDARNRRDLGVSRIDLRGGDTQQVVPPFTAGDDFGPVFATSLSWDAAGSTLAVQSCGAEECHTRLLDPQSGTISEHRDGHGVLVALTATELIAFGAGHERPAALLAISIADGSTRVLAEHAYAAELVGTAARPVIRVETLDGWMEVTP